MNLLIIGVGHLAKILIEEIRIDEKSKIINITGTSRDIKRISDLPLDQLIELYHLDEALGNKIFDYILFALPPIPEYQELLQKCHLGASVNTKWIFISSTGVYNRGRNSKALLENENLLSTFDRDIYIVRPGGLIDETRNPVFILSQRDEVQGFNQPINVVHTRDVARFIKFLIENNSKVDEYDLVSDDSMLKSEFYGQFFKYYNLKSPKMIDTEENRIHFSNRKSKEIGFEYIAPMIFSYISKRD